MKRIMNYKSFFKRKSVIWISILVLFTVGQMTALWRIDHFLASPSISALASAAGTEKGTGKDASESFLIPPDAVQSLISPDNQYAAYTTPDHDLVLVGQGQFKSIPNAAPISFMSWLGNSDTLLYFVQGSYLDAYLIQPHEQKPLLIHEWWGNQRTVEKVFFSPYMEFLYMDLKRENSSSFTDEVYKYDAVNGIKQIPLYNVQFRTIEYDDMTDTMLLTTSLGKVWKYTNGHLYAPDGTEVYDPKSSPKGSTSGTNSSATPNSSKTTGSNTTGGSVSSDLSGKTESGGSSQKGSGNTGTAGSGSSVGIGSSTSGGSGAASSTGSEKSGTTPANNPSGSSTTGKPPANPSSKP